MESDDEAEIDQIVRKIVRESEDIGEYRRELLHERPFLRVELSPWGDGFAVFSELRKGNGLAELYEDPLSDGLVVKGFTTREEAEQYVADYGSWAHVLWERTCVI
jgi:hypothetical protein